MARKPMNEILHFDLAESLRTMLPELSLVIIILLLTISAIFYRERTQLIRIIALVVFTIQVLLDIYQWKFLETHKITGIFGSALLDYGPGEHWWILVVDVFMLLVIALPVIDSMKRHVGEYFILLSGMLLGVHFLILSASMLTMFISLELISLSSYLLVSLTRASIESGFKYFLFGAAATAVMLYGMSLWYGMTGELSLRMVPADVEMSDPLMLVAIVLISAGILFKISGVPWHIWVPDVYQQSPAPVVAVISVIPKTGGFILAWKWMELLNWPGEVIAVLAVITMSVGNFAALRQTNVKRMMGYSSIAHSGFLLMGLISASMAEYFGFYLVIYGIMNLGTFFLIYFYERRYAYASFDDYRGAFRHSSWLGGCVVVFMISLTGIPPTAGFTAKLLLFTGVINGYLTTGEHFLAFVLVFGLINTVVALAFYLQLPYMMIFKKNEKPEASSVKIAGMENFLSGILVVGILLLFFKPEWLMRWINSVSFVF